jgi:cell division protein FtsZ
MPSSARSARWRPSTVKGLVTTPTVSASSDFASTLEGFRMADEVLLQGVQGITELITTPGLINLDFADVKTVMTDAGSSLMGIGQARGENRASEAARAAISSPLLEASIDGARSVLLNIAGGSDLGLFEINEAAGIISKSAHPDANIILGTVVDDTLGDEVRVTVIAAGFDRWGQREAEDLVKPDEEIFSAAGIDAGEREEPESEPERLVFDADEELDVPSFLRNE